MVLSLKKYAVNGCTQRSCQKWFEIRKCNGATCEMRLGSRKDFSAHFPLAEHFLSRESQLDGRSRRRVDTVGKIVKVVEVILSG